MHTTAAVISIKFPFSGQNQLPQGNARVNESGSSIKFELQQPTNPLPPNVTINFCSGSVGITIMSSSGQIKSLQKMWNMGLCDFESGQAQVSLAVQTFPGSTSRETYTVTFNISFHIDGVGLCYLQLAVDNITVSHQGKLYSIVI